MKVNKTLWMLILLLIVIGMILIFTKGFHIGLVYSKSQTVNLVLDKEFEAKEIKTIAKEVFKNKNFMVNKTDILEQSVNITAETITVEEKEEIITKLNEKYELEIAAEDVEIQQNTNVRLRDLAKPYLFPSLIAAFIVLVVTEIKYRKKGILKVFGISILAMIGCIFITASIFAIFRIPVNQLSVPIGIACEIFAMIWMDKKIEEIKQTQE